MVNIVEFEEDVSPKNMDHHADNNSMLSTPFNLDEPNESKITNLHFKTHGKFLYSQSVLANH